MTDNGMSRSKLYQTYAERLTRQGVTIDELLNAPGPNENCGYPIKLQILSKNKKSRPVHNHRSLM